MKLNRRNCLGVMSGLAACAAMGPVQAAKVAARKRVGSPRVAFNALNAPDALSRRVLVRPLIRLTDGQRSGENPLHAIRRNFPSLIEQNLACAAPGQLAALFDGLDPRTLAVLAQVYLNATEFAGREPIALQLMAHRLNAPRLARLAPFFGAPRLQDAILRVAPHKVDAFNPMVNYNHLGPRSLETQAVEMRGGGSPGAPSYLIFLDYTIEEIYLSFRTAPVGATSVGASMLQTGIVVGSAVFIAWNGGQAIGGYLAKGMQVYTPSLWDRLVDGVGRWVDTLREPPQTPPDSYQSPEEQNGVKQRDGYLDAFELGPEQYDDFALGGGDYQSTEDWADAVPYEPFPGAPICGPLEDGCGEIHPQRSSVTRPAR